MKYLFIVSVLPTEDSGQNTISLEKQRRTSRFFFVLMREVQCFS